MSFLYLDDIRTPNPSYNAIIVRDGKAFKEYIINNGIPDVISFDHDLGKDWEIELIESGMSKRKARELKREYNVENGLDIARWLIEYSQSKGLKLNEVYVHSANPVGTENIISLINSFKKFCGQNENCARRIW